MPPLLLVFSDRLYQFLLQAYPARLPGAFRFGDGQVYRSLCRETYAQSGAGGVLRLWLPVLWDWMRAALHQWYSWLAQKKDVDDANNPTGREDNIRPLTVAQAAIAVLPFLAFGLSNMWMNSSFYLNYPTGLPLWQTLLIHPDLVFNWLVLIGLGIGLLAGFPRWAFTYLGWAVLFGWWWSDMGFYGYHMGAEIWLPFLGIFLLALLIRRSWQPLRTLFTRLWGEWTLFSFSIYILYAHVSILYDENHHPYLLAFIGATALATALGAWGYFRSEHPAAACPVLGRWAGRSCRPLRGQLRHLGLPCLLRLARRGDERRSGIVDFHFRSGLDLFAKWPAGPLAPYPRLPHAWKAEHPLLIARPTSLAWSFYLCKFSIPTQPAAPVERSRPIPNVR
jgi:hypothetical protein